MHNRGEVPSSCLGQSYKIILILNEIRNQLRAAEYVKFNYQDALNLDSQLTEDEKIMRDAARDYCQSKLMPRVLMANRHESMFVKRKGNMADGLYFRQKRTPQ